MELLTTYAVALAGGRGARYDPVKDKLWEPIAGLPLWLHSVRRLAQHPQIAGVVVVAPESQHERFRRHLNSIPKIVGLVPGGDTRQASCAAGCASVPTDADRIAVHDCARPNLSAALLDRVLGPYEDAAVVPGVSMSETIKRVHNWLVAETLDRTGIYRMQTPQVVQAEWLRRAHRELSGRFTDEAAMIEAIGGTVRVVEGDVCNIKVTVEQDREIIRSLMERAPIMVRTGFGYDVHRLEAGIPLVLGGVHIDYSRGLAAHSDGDALTHAICDALLGAAGLPDIGVLFPNSNPELKGIDSQVLLKEVGQRIRAEGWLAENVDSTVIAEEPKIAPYTQEMRQRLAGTLGILPEQVNVKATTNEGLGELGSGQGIAAYAVVTIQKQVGG